MNFSIPCETFSRLAIIANAPNDHYPDEWAKSIRIENNKGKSFAIASNRIFMVVEFIGNTGEPDGAIHIPIEAALLNQCKTETPFDSKLEIAYNEVLGFAAAKTTMGYNLPGNAMVTFASENKIAGWRDIIPQPPKKAFGGMFWNAENIALLAKAAPTGRVVFPDIIDCRLPIILRDPNNPNWFALFTGTRVDDAGKIEILDPAKVPDWVSK